jgi:hypothetical protein
MKTFLKLIVLPLLGLMVLTACPAKKDSNGNAAAYCDAFGNCYNGNGSPYIPPGSGNPANQIVLDGGFTVDDSSLMKKIKEGVTGCNPPNAPDMCWGYQDVPPSITAVFNDYTQLTTGTKSGWGQLVIGGYYAYNVVWKVIDNNTAIDTQIQLPYDYKGRFLRVRLQAPAPTASAMGVQVFYGGSPVGEGQVTRY